MRIASRAAFSTGDDCPRAAHVVPQGSTRHGRGVGPVRGPALDFPGARALLIRGEAPREAVVMQLAPALISLLAVTLLMLVIWAVHLRDEDASIVDPFWGVAIWVVGWTHGLAMGVPFTGDRLVVFTVAFAWAARLAAHLHARHREVGEDRRYRAMREARGDSWWWRSVYVVFLLQAALAWVVALPLIAISLAPVQMGPGGWAGLVLAFAGFLYESVADGQLAAFRRRRDGEAPEGQQPVMDQGLWRFSRHPNYFGELMVWWGFGGVAAFEGHVWALAGPLVITFMLVKVSGVALTEADISSRRPAYAEYIRRTNALIPGSPR